MRQQPDYSRGLCLPPKPQDSVLIQTGQQLELADSLPGALVELRGQGAEPAYRASAGTALIARLSDSSGAVAVEHQPVGLVNSGWQSDSQSDLREPHLSSSTRPSDRRER